MEVGDRSGFPLPHLELEVHLLKIAKPEPISSKLNASIVCFFLVLKLNKEKCNFSVYTLRHCLYLSTLSLKYLFYPLA